MISHQYIGMNSDVVSLACITQAIQQEPIIVFFEEARVSIIATLNYMIGYARQVYLWLSWHRNFLFLYNYRFLESIRYLYYCEGFSCTSDSFNSLIKQFPLVGPTVGAPGFLQTRPHGQDLAIR
jgi:hypothetical protein